MTKTTLAALALAAPLAALGQYDPRSAPPQSEWGTEPAPAPSQWGAPTAPQPAPAPAPAPARRPDHVREPWYIGFGVGGGGGSVTDTWGTHAFSRYVGPDPMQISMNFQVGATLSPSLLLGFDGQFLAASSSDAASGDTQIQLNSYDVALTWFPMEKGLFVKGATGLSALQVSNASADGSWRGFNLSAGVGYAFWIGRTFNLSLNLDTTMAWFTGDPDLESARMTNLYLGFMWY